MDETDSLRVHAVSSDQLRGKTNLETMDLLAGGVLPTIKVLLSRDQTPQRLHLKLTSFVVTVIIQQGSGSFMKHPVRLHHKDRNYRN